ncbi:glycosyltransferase family 4 protein [Acidimangrovimonas sediminis]|uniref:glycosyltransferase family 4 protein n=1 Tax=Acidimangrovimonas sediminis TaxID=2056283 RepID=UPI0018EBCC14|nr:glycosyltransferase [Acidimangrovimonas sediminis]
MARQLVAALEGKGHRVREMSTLRAFSRDNYADALDHLHTLAGAEVARLTEAWRQTAPPRLWLTYHPYYKAPDLIGPVLCRRFGLPYVTVETSHSPRRDGQGWAGWQAEVLAGIDLAAVNICLTGRDRQGILAARPGARVAELPPFLDPGPFALVQARPGDSRTLAVVAMMRPGDKLESYRRLAAALSGLTGDWRLAIVGDGPERAAVDALFAGIPLPRIEWCGQLPPEAVARVLSRAALLVWPGCGEAYGLAYLEAQCAGLPVVAEATAGVPDVVAEGRTGLLVPEGDTAALTAALARLLDDPALRDRMGAAARDFVLGERSAARAGERLDAILAGCLKGAA